MLDTADVKILTRWCRDRRLNWMPARADDGAQAVSLGPIGRSSPWRDMLVVAGDDGFCLLDAPGATLATASDLPALLDALDAGVAESRPQWRAGQQRGNHEARATAR
jgi:hypothetical protein